MEQETFAQTADRLWAELEAAQGQFFTTAKGLEFTYVIRGNEMFVDRKNKSITRSSVELALEKALALGQEATGPKKLGCFGASYLYPLFQRFGVLPEKDADQVRLF